jgi:anti-sigma factor (TIGR02949 family)
MSLDPTDVSAAIDCSEVVRSLDAYLDGELAEPEQAELEAHLAACPTCRTRVEAEGRVRTALRARLRRALGSGSIAGHAPPELRERIHLALARGRRPTWRRVLAPLPLAALAACAAGVLLVLVTHGGTDPLVEEAVQKHARDLPLEVTAASIGPESIAHWFAGKLDFNPAPPQFRGAEVRLVGARLSHIQDRPAAYVRYDLPRGHLGLFILDDPHRRFYDELGRLVHAGPDSLRVINARGFNVAVWRRNELVYSLVSDLDEQDLAKLVQAAQVATER